MGALRGLTRGLAIIKVIILARILTPSQFGLYGIALLVLGFLEIILETGVNVVLIQEEDDTDEYINTAWIVSILRGAVISGIIFMLAPTISSFFASPGSLGLVRFIALVPLVRGFVNPSIFKFQKELAFNKEFWYRGSLYFVDALGAIGIGLATHSEYALIWGMLLAALIEIFLSFIVVTPRPSLGYEPKKARKIIGRGKWITLAGTFEYLFQHLDDIVVGKVLGVTPLGLYQQAYRISTLPITEVGEIFNKVTFPTYAKISQEKKRLQNAFLKVTAVVSILVVPFGILLFIFAKQVVVILLGQNWIAAIPALKVLAIFGILKSLSNSAYSLFLSVRKQEIVTLITLFGILGLGVTILPLVRGYGIVGAAWSTIIGTLVSAPIVIYHLLGIFKHDRTQS